jgi:hypothetical protein
LGPICEESCRRRGRTISTRVRDSPELGRKRLRRHRRRVRGRGADGSIGTITVLSDAVAADRKASEAEVRAHRIAIRRLANALDVSGIRVRNDGAVVIHTTDAGYHTANRLSVAASEVVGAYVHVITDDVPGAAGARDL